MKQFWIIGIIFALFLSGCAPAVSTPVTTDEKLAPHEFKRVDLGNGDGDWQEWVKSQTELLQKEKERRKQRDCEVAIRNFSGAMDKLKATWNTTYRTNVLRGSARDAKTASMHCVGVCEDSIKSAQCLEAYSSLTELIKLLDDAND